MPLITIAEEHDEVLQFSNHLQLGLRKGIEKQRLKRYADWFKENHIDLHFEMERRYIFSLLHPRNVRMKRALANHRRLNRLFGENDSIIALNKIEEELGSYIRFEERILYPEIRKVATAAELKMIEEVHCDLVIPEEGWTDRFWIA